MTTILSTSKDHVRVDGNKNAQNKKIMLNIHLYEQYFQEKNNILNHPSMAKLKENYNTQKLNRSFLLQLENSILKCTGNGSYCDLYRCWIDPEDEEKDYFNCHHFAYIALYHTTTDFDHCNEDKISDVIITTWPIYKLKAQTTNIDTFVQAIATLKNKMCYVGIKDQLRGNDVHSLAIEIRTNGFYIYNSWLNTFSNSWFSGLKEGKMFFNEKMSLEVKKITMEYRNKCGLGKLLTKSGLRYCFKILEKVANTYKPGLVKQMTIGRLTCRSLNEKFKALE